MHFCAARVEENELNESEMATEEEVATCMLREGADAATSVARQRLEAQLIVDVVSALKSAASQPMSATRFSVPSGPSRPPPLCFAVIGAAGSGKTSLLRRLASHLRRCAQPREDSGDGVSSHVPAGDGVQRHPSPNVHMPTSTMNWTPVVCHVETLDDLLQAADQLKCRHGASQPHAAASWSSFTAPCVALLDNLDVMACLARSNLSGHTMARTSLLGSSSPDQLRDVDDTVKGQLAAGLAWVRREASVVVMTNRSVDVPSWTGVLWSTVHVRHMPPDEPTTCHRRRPMLLGKIAPHPSLSATRITSNGGDPTGNGSDARYMEVWVAGARDPCSLGGGGSANVRDEPPCRGVRPATMRHVMAQRCGCREAWRQLQQCVGMSLQAAVHRRAPSANDDALWPAHAGDEESGLKRVRDYVQPSSGILLTGPSGCGKSLCISLLAGDMADDPISYQHASLIVVECSQIFGRFLGESEARLRATFRRARAMAPCVLVFRNVELVAVRRGTSGGGRGGDDSGGGRSGEGGGSADIARRMLAAMLIEIDGVGSEDADILVIGISNRPWDLDPAMLRGGRLETHVFAPAMTADDIQTALRAYHRAWNAAAVTASSWSGRPCRPPDDCSGDDGTAAFQSFAADFAGCTGAALALTIRSLLHHQQSHLALMTDAAAESSSTSFPRLLASIQTSAAAAAMVERGLLDAPAACRLQRALAPTGDIARFRQFLKLQ